MSVTPFGKRLTAAPEQPDALAILGLRVGSDIGTIDSATADEIKTVLDITDPGPATETEAGIAELATQAETDAATDDERIVTPLKLGAWAANIAGSVIDNGAMDVWQRGNASASSSAGSRTFLADRWYVNPTGAAVTQQRSTTVPSGERSRYSLELNGAASVTTVLIGQRIEAAQIPTIKRTVTFSAQIRNESGTAFTPDLLLGTPAASDDFTTVTNRLTVTLQSCADSAWTQVSHTVDISGYTNIDNGLQVEIEIPSGSLVASDTVRITEVQLIPAGGLLPFSRRPIDAEVQRCQRYFCKSYNLDVPVGSVTTAGQRYAVSISAGAGFVYDMIDFPVEMRAAPTGTIYNPASGTAGQWERLDGTNVNGTASQAGTRGMLLQNTAGTLSNNGHNTHYTADAEL